MLKRIHAQFGLGLPRGRKTAGNAAAKPENVRQLWGGAYCDLQWLEVKPGPQARPVLAFIHVHESGSPQVRWPVLFSEYLAQGVAVATLNCDFGAFPGFAPLLAEAGRALQWLAASGRELGMDPNRMLLAGKGMGAHMAAFFGTALPSYVCPSVRAVVGLSGIYSLLPLLECSGMESVLTPLQARRLSPARATRFNAERFVIASGPDDCEALQRQGKSLLRRLSTQGRSAELLQVTGRQPDLLQVFADPRSALFQRTLACLQGR